jgi:hypothetical protein
VKSCENTGTSGKARFESELRKFRAINLPEFE